MKSTLLGALVLVIMATGLLGFRGYFLAQRDAGEQQLHELAPAIAAYAATHDGLAPATLEELRAAAGAVPRSPANDAPYLLTNTPTRWNDGEPAPYLWDPMPYPFVGGVHVLYSDGTIRLEEALPAGQ